MKRVFFVILFFLAAISANSQVLSNKKVITNAIDSIFNSPSINTFLSKTDSIYIYRGTKDGIQHFEECLNKRNSNIRYFEIFKDKIIKKRLVILDNKPIIQKFEVDSSNMNNIIRTTKIDFNLQMFELFESPVYEFRIEKKDTIITDHGQIPNNIIEEKDLTFYQKYIEPSILYSASLGVILILFFVRS